MDESRIIEVDKWNGLYLEEYNGRWSLASLQQGSGENLVWYQKWVWDSRFKDGKPRPHGDKARPEKVLLGKDGWPEARHNLITLIKQGDALNSK